MKNWHWWALGGGFLLAWWYAHVKEKKRKERFFEKQAEQAKEYIERKMEETEV